MAREHFRGKGNRGRASLDLNFTRWSEVVEACLDEVAEARSDEM